MDPLLEHFAVQGLEFPLVPSSEGLLPSDEARLYWARFGSGRPVLLLHGGMGNSTQWSHQIGALVSSGREVVVLDTRGHGRSSSGNQAFSYKLLALDALRLLDHLGLPTADLLGWSDGACTALELARQWPKRVGSVVFFACNVDPSGTKPFVMSATIGNCLRRHQLDYERLAPGPDSFETLGPRLEPMQRNEPNYSAEDLAAIAVPVSVLQAEHDEFIQESHARYLAEQLPHGRFERLDGVSHFAPVQNPELFNAAVLRALKATSRTST